MSLCEIWAQMGRRLILVYTCHCYLRNINYIAEPPSYVFLGKNARKSVPTRKRYDPMSLKHLAGSTVVGTYIAQIVAAWDANVPPELLKSSGPSCILFLGLRLRSHFSNSAWISGFFGRGIQAKVPTCLLGGYHWHPRRRHASNCRGPSDPKHALLFSISVVF